MQYNIDKIKYSKIIYYKLKYFINMKLNVFLCQNMFTKFAYGMLNFSMCTDVLHYQHTSVL